MGCALTLVTTVPSLNPSPFYCLRAPFNLGTPRHQLVHIMSSAIIPSADILMPLTRMNSDSEGSVVHIRSLSLEGAWRVPLSLVQMEVQEIIRLAVTVSSPATTQGTNHLFSTTFIAHPGDPLVNSSPQPPEVVQSSAACVSLEQAPTASETRTLQEYQALMALGSVFALVKYWAFMRMLWRHVGESDRVVISVMAHSENMKQPAPLRNAKNRKRWTIVRHGLNLMEILLNNRSLLLEVMTNRLLSFTNLICLRSDFITSTNLVRLLEKTQQLTVDTNNTHGTALSLATLSALCQQGTDRVSHESTTRLLTSSSPSSTTSPDKDQRTSGGVAIDQVRSARRRGGSTASPPSKKRKRHWEKSSTRNQNRARLSRLSNDSRSAGEHEKPQRHQQIDEQNNEDSAQVSSSQQRSDSSFSSAGVLGPPSARAQLRTAVQRMESVPLLDYYHQLLETYPHHLSVAAPLHCDSVELYQQTMSHRLHEQCSTCIPLYDHAFLLQCSDRLRFLPAVSVTEDAQKSMDKAGHYAYSATKVWVFAHKREGDCIVESVCQQLRADDDGTPLASDDRLLLPAGLLLQHGAHLLLVFQREGETIALPSHADVFVLHCVHDVVAGTTLSTSGMVCSHKHLVETLERRAAVTDVDSHATCQPSEMEQHTITLPAGVFKSSPLPSPIVLTKPTAATLSRAMQSMRSTTVAADFDSLDQLLYVLDQSLDDLHRNKLSPPPRLLPMLQLLHRHRGLSDGPHQAALLALLAKVIALHSVAVDATPYVPCSPGLGCGVAKPQDHTLPCMIVAQCAEPTVVFRYSELYTQPLLYVRTPPHSRSQHTELGAKFVDVVINGQSPCTYKTRISLPEVTKAATTRAPCCSSSAPADDDNDDDFLARWRQRTQLSTRTVSPTPLSIHSLRSSQVISVADLEPTDPATISTLRAKLSAFLPMELVDGGVLKWCQAMVYSPSYHLFAASELAIANRQIHSVPFPFPTSEDAQGMGWYNHMVSHRLRLGSSRFVALATVTQATKQAMIEELYGLCTNLNSLAQAADAVDESSQCLLSPFVATTYGELDQASVQTVIQCMVENGLRDDSLFLDIGCCYCKVLVHVAYATGINVYGVEAMRERSERGRRCVQSWKATHPELEQQTGGIEIISGDIIHNLHLLFPASHVLLVDASFMSSTRNVLKHIWGHLAESKLQMVFSCTLLEEVNGAMERVAQLRVNMGKDDLTLYAYRIKNTLPAIALEVFPSPVHGFGLRATRDFLEHEYVMEMLGERSSIYSKDDCWPWMVRLADGWMHVENLARFVNWHHDPERMNVSVSVDADGTLCLKTTRLVRTGDELLSSPSCWPFSATGELESEMLL